jgi:multicomponent Na+:H+ antiporter subunit E
MVKNYLYSKDMTSSPDKAAGHIDRQPTAGSGLTLLVMVAIVWLLLTGSLAVQELVAGVLVTAAVTLIAYPRSGILGGVRWSFGTPWYIAVYLWVFCVALFKSNFDVARRVLTPSLPIRPGVVQVRTELTSALGRMLLANSITLTPGTLTIDVEGDLLTIHWIDCPPDIDLDTATAAIAADFEVCLRRFVR